MEDRSLRRPNHKGFPFMVFGYKYFFWGKTKTLQTVTLRVAILSVFLPEDCHKTFGAKLKQKSAQVRAVFLENLLAQNSHLQFTVCGVLVVLIF